MSATGKCELDLVGPGRPRPVPALLASHRCSPCVFESHAPEQRGNTGGGGEEWLTLELSK